MSSDNNFNKKPWPLIVQDFSSLLAHESLPVLKDSFVKIDDALFNLSQSSALENDHFDSLRVIRNSKTSMFASWIDIVKEESLSWSNSKIQNTESYELSLVSVTELEEKLATDQMAESFYKNNSKSFNALIDVFNDIIATNDIKGDISSFPLHHEGFANLISKWMSSLSLGIESQLVVMKIIEKEVNKSLPSILDKMISFFNDNGWEVLSPEPQKTHHQFNPSSQSQSAPNNHSLDEDEVDDSGWEGLEQVESLDGSVPSLPPSIPPPPQPSMMSHGYNHPQSYPHPTPHFQPYFPGYTQTPQRADFKSVKSASYILQALLDGDNINDVDDVDDDEIQQWGQASDFSNISEDDWDPTVIELVNLIKSKRKNKKTKDKSKEDSASASYFMSQDQIRSVLNNMQKSIPQSVKIAARENNQSLTEQFKEEIISRAVELGLANNDSKLDDQHEDAIDIVGMLFEIFLSERQIMEDMRESIASLLAPYVKVALMDRKMFMHKSHPARRFLDVLAEACEGNFGASNQEKNTLNKVEESIDNLISEFNEDVAIFEFAEGEIKEFLNQQRLAVELSEKRALEAQKGKERLASAREKSLDIFISTTEKCNWPVKTHEMLKKYWCQHHSIILLRHEDDEMKIKSSEYILKTLVKMGMSGISNIGGEGSNIHNYILDMLRSNGIIEQGAESIAVEIWSALEQASKWQQMAERGVLSKDDVQKHEIQNHAVIEKESLHQKAEEEKAKEEKEEDEILSKTSESESETNKNINISDYFSSRQEIVQYFENMEAGTWIDFVKPDGAIVSTKLSWVSPISKRLLFVTQRGLKHAVESPKDLAILVILGKIKLRKVGLGENGFERSLKKAIETLSDKESEDSQENSQSQAI